MVLTLAAPTSALWVAAKEPAPQSRAGDAAITGRYEYRDDELVGSIELHSDHTFAYKVDGIRPPVPGEGPFHLLVQGEWRSDGSGRLSLTNAPSSPPIFRQTSAVRDPTVRAALTIQSTDGDPAYDLGLLTDDGENGQMDMLSDGRWTIPLRHGWDTDDGNKGSPTTLPRNWEILRASDNLSLARIALSPSGPNRFAFRYTRSPIEPFSLAAEFVEDMPSTIEVEFGTASLKMNRADPKQVDEIPM
jgi:hypothetical protein